jgi:predicted AAA+ superfamily ATPase
MIPRTLAQRLKQAARQFPLVTVTGPRQSGKTTLVRHTFPDYAYCSLELPDERAFALEDPRGFLKQFDGPVILDEAQRTPELFSYLQAVVDERDRPGQFILTGSQNFLLLQTISQSLAGRCAILHLLPFSLAELCRRAPARLEQLGSRIPRLAPPRQTLETLLFSGGYPRIHDKALAPQHWLGPYYQTYLERDVRNVLQVGDLDAFSRFTHLCAGRAGQLLNLSSLASDCGVTHTTASRWIAVLEASFVLLLLRPHHRNWGKRVIKSPKLFFLDTGLLCFLLRIKTPQELMRHALRGPIFESFVLSELYKNAVHRGDVPALSFWRDASGHEVDFLIDLGTRLLLVEAKSARTVASDFFEGIGYWRRVSRRPRAPAALIYAGDQPFTRHGVVVHPWFAL